MCHQTVGLVARHLESLGIPTVVLGSARDIIEHCGVPRFQFTDFPLGNPCGKPYDGAMQEAIVGAALSLFETATEPRTMQRSPFEWGSDDWRQKYLEIRPEDIEKLRLAGEERRKARQELRDTGRVRTE